MIASKIIGKLLFFCLIFQFLLVKQQFLVKKHLFSQLSSSGKVAETPYLFFFHKILRKNEEKENEYEAKHLHTITASSAQIVIM